MRQLTLRLLTLVASALLPAAACAQDAGGGQSTSSTSSTASQAGQSFGGSATGGGTAGGGGGIGGSLQGPQFVEFGQAGANIGEGFVGRGNNQQAFVGSSAAGQQTVDAGGTARFSGFGGAGGQGAAADVGQARGGQMRIPQRIAFRVPPITPTTLTSSLQTQFNSLRDRLPGVGVTSTEPGHVVLTGTVESEQARRLAAAIVRLEPGVRRVTNELQIAGEAPEPVLPRLSR